jgi:DNA polymerase-3 subunit epsilon
MIALFFDTETTGFKKPGFTPEIVQIGALLQDTETKQILAELNVIVTPKNPIPQVVSDIHGITDEVAEKYGVASLAAENMFALMVQMADIAVAHNIKFDLDIIAGVWPVAYGFLVERQQFCTMLKSTDIVGLTGTHAGRNKWPRLTEAYAHFFDGAAFDNAHNAMADVRACRDIYFKLVEAK